jgi:hypothetical protein
MKQSLKMDFSARFVSSFFRLASKIKALSFSPQTHRYTTQMIVYVISGSFIILGFVALLKQKKQFRLRWKQNNSPVQC